MEKSQERKGYLMSCNCNQNRRCNGCASFGCAQHIRVNQNTACSMGNGPCCCRHACCCRCCPCNHRPAKPVIDYACLRRAEREFERRVARCMGICGWNEENGLEEEITEEYTTFTKKMDETE